MQYPYLVFFADDKTVDRYLVHHNDRTKAGRRAVREHGAGREMVRICELTPKQENGEFLPRIDGVLVSPQAYPTQAEAVAASIKFLDERRTKT